MWFRRDLRLSDNPALAAAAAGSAVLGVFVLDPALIGASGAARLAVLYRSLDVLDDQLRGRLVIRRGKPETVLPRLCREVDASSVHCAADFGPYGTARDAGVQRALALPLVRTGSAYAVDPGSVGRPGGGYQVYSAFYRAWSEFGWEPPGRAATVDWIEAESEAIPGSPASSDAPALPPVGEFAARRAWVRFRDDRHAGLATYAAHRDRPDLDATSRMSVHLKWGAIHPRSMLADLGAADTPFRRQLAWREFYADVLFRHPASAREYYRPELTALRYRTGADADRCFLAWQQGRTGFPIVDAGMRQLLTEGWMHNRVRMIVASFLKDLHIEWQRGARHFMNHLIDGDLASNSHGWQWVAGSGTDAAPYFRIFNPTLQARKFDPNGDYVRRYVPELAHLPVTYIHDPAADPNGAPAGYPAPIVDHAIERRASLADYHSSRG